MNPKAIPPAIAAGTGAATLVVASFVIGWWAVIPAAVIAAGAFALAQKKAGATQPPKMTLPEFFDSCRERIRRMRVLGISIKNDHEEKDFGANVLAVAMSYDRIVGELERNPLYIVETGGVLVSLEALVDSLESCVVRAAQARTNPDLRGSLDKDKLGFADIQTQVEKNLKNIQGNQQMNAAARMKALLAVICPDQHKLTKLSDQKK